MQSSRPLENGCFREGPCAAGEVMAGRGREGKGRASPGHGEEERNMESVQGKGGLQFGGGFQLDWERREFWEL